ncbi:hypothetical protein ACJMK2_007774 [Sinanodonta woodiana]|uniref:2-phosphoxylose phosphatase 1 n=1 Tax=Sinanodonta woodiana TaxID=1069815 RepID=A0ABD3VKH9_SINWO
MHTIKGYKPPPIRCVFDHTLAGNNKKFHEFLPTMHKYYGAQTKSKRFQNWSLFPERPLCDSGSLLTGVGALQHLKNGYFLSQKYMNHSTLFDQNKSIIAQVYVRTTEYSRTYQSMIAFMYGFLPEFDLTLLNFEPSDNLRFCSAQKAKIAACTCKEKDRLKSKDNFSHLFHTNNTEYGNIQAELAEIFKIKPSQLPKLGVILDVLMTQLCHRHPLYCNDENKCLSAPLIDALWKLQNAETTAKARYDERYRKTCRLEMHPVLLEIAHRFSDVKQGKTTSKFVLYSGHDLTLTPLLHSLSVFDGKWPGFASRVVIELYLQYPNTKKNFYLKFLYNGKDLTEEVIFCRGKTFQGMCKLKYYFDFIFEESLKEFGYDSYEEACR